MPFPSNFHLNHEVQRPFLYERTDRPYLVSYVGSAVFAATKMRKEMLKFCALHSADCRHSHYNKNGERETELADGAENPHYKYSLRSVFCLQPMGDLPTRKGLFDAIVFGCIPVVFHPLSASRGIGHRSSGRTLQLRSPWIWLIVISPYSSRTPYST